MAEVRKGTLGFGRVSIEAVEFINNIIGWLIKNGETTSIWNCN